MKVKIEEENPNVSIHQNLNKTILEKKLQFNLTQNNSTQLNFTHLNS